MCIELGCIRSLSGSYSMLVECSLWDVISELVLTVLSSRNFYTTRLCQWLLWGDVWIVDPILLFCKVCLLVGDDMRITFWQVKFLLFPEVFFLEIQLLFQPMDSRSENCLKPQNWASAPALKNKNSSSSNRKNKPLTGKNGHWVDAGQYGFSNFLNASTQLSQFKVSGHFPN